MLSPGNRLFRYNNSKNKTISNGSAHTHCPNVKSSITARLRLVRIASPKNEGKNVSAYQRPTNFDTFATNYWIATRDTVIISAPYNRQ